MRATKILQMWRMMFPNTDIDSSRGSNIYLPCPLAEWSPDHKSKKDFHPSFSVRNTVNRSLCACWACGFKGTLRGLIFALAEYSGEDQTELLEFVKNSDDCDFRDIIDEFEEEPPDTMVKPKDENILDQFTDDPILRTVFTEKEIAEWGILYDPEKNGAVLPVRGFDGLLYGATGRPFGKGKYYNYWRFHKSKFLFGEHKFPSGKIALVEGPRDVITLSRYMPAVALMGWKASKHQLAKIKELYDEIVLFLDNDKSGRRGTLALIQELHGTVPLHVAYYGSRTEKDPNEIDRDLPNVPLVKVSRC